MDSHHHLWQNDGASYGRFDATSEIAGDFTVAEFEQTLMCRGIDAAKPRGAAIVEENAL